MDLNNTVDSVVTDIYRILCLTTAGYTFFSNAHRTFSSIDHALGHKTSLSKLTKTEIIPNISSDHNGMKLEIGKRSKTG